MKQYLPVLLSLFISGALVAQQNNNYGGGPYTLTPLDEITPEVRLAIFDDIKQNESVLKAAGKLIATQKMAALPLQFPLAWNDGVTGYNFYGISNYVDHNAAFPNQLTDWNCGTRTYDTDGGYNHQGIDYFLWPFDWNLMQDQAVKIIAAAPGQIVGRYDGQFDQNCAFNPGSWNAVYVRHADGSLAWYGHMKSGSVTTKTLGEMVEAGEYLGTVGSSGNSTGPHLHFEVYNADDNLIDPYSGICNDFNVESWWADQPEYIAPTINKMQTNSSPPEFMPCPELHITHESNNFMPGEICYFMLYAKDLSPTDLCHLSITQADGTIWQDFDFSQPEYYIASYWYWWYTLPNVVSEGTWTWSCDLAGEHFEHEFVVGDLPIAIDNISGFAQATAAYQSGNIIVNLNNSNATNAHISVVNALGQTVIVERNYGTDQATIQLPVQQLNSGVYYVVIGDNETTNMKTLPIVIHE